MSKEKEDMEILVIKRDILFSKEYFSGFKFIRDVPDYDEVILENYEFMRRADAEVNFDYKQPIPFMVPFRRKDMSIFSYTYDGGEDRLSGIVTIGVMGHIEKIDASNGNPITNASKRELKEEIKITGSKGEIIQIPFGYVNLDRRPEDKVHFGLVSLINVDDLEVRARDESLVDARFREVSELEKMCKEGDINLCTWTMSTFYSVKKYMEGNL